MNLRPTFLLLLTVRFLTLTFSSCAVSDVRAAEGVSNRNGPYRPQVHFSPLKNWMNDPNGLFLDAGGTYHLYYQYNPTGVIPGNQHWGHATSNDLYHWVDQPVAISPPTSDTQVYSGSAVIDVNNTSGFFPNQTNGVVAIYTLNTPSAEVQEIAYSLDGGYTFTRYTDNPVINSTSTQFRDPKVIWHGETGRWAMVVAFSQDFVIGIYTSPDLKTWTHTSNFSHHGLLGLQYECPNLVRMPVRDYAHLESPPSEYAYVLSISVNPGAPLGGSATQYFPGAFNGTHFIPVDGATRLIDFAKYNYAGQFYYGTPQDGDALFIAWAANGQYGQAVPTAQEGWRSAMSLPRRTFLTNASLPGWDLVSLPFDLGPVLGAPLALTTMMSGDDPLVVDYAQVASNALYFEANVSSGAAALTFAFSSPVSNESVSTGFAGDAFLDRGETRGFANPFFTDKFSATAASRADGTWSLSGVIDRSIIEVFVNGGVKSATATFFSTEPLTSMMLTATGLPAGASVSVAVYGLNSVWGE